jgi:hypothetical protein
LRAIDCSARARRPQRRADHDAGEQARHPGRDDDRRVLVGARARDQPPEVGGVDRGRALREVHGREEDQHARPEHRHAGHPQRADGQRRGAGREEGHPVSAVTTASA